MGEKTILITGGAGYIGAHVNHRLLAAGYQTVVLDNLSTGKVGAVPVNGLVIGDMGDSALLDRLLESRPFDAVMHFAAYSDVGESMRDPLKYYQNNVAGTLQLVSAMRRHGVNKLVFSSSAAIFGLPQEEAISESHPTLPINPYGQSKLMVENVLRDCDTAFGLKTCSLRYFNAAGWDPTGRLKPFKRDEHNLIPLLLQSIRKGECKAHIFGTDYPTRDGTCIRDYIHVSDLAACHILALERLLTGGSSSSYNLGNGRGFTVLEVVEAVERVAGCRLERVFLPRRPGDPPALIADSAKARQELGWVPQYPALDSMVAF